VLIEGSDADRARRLLMDEQGKSQEERHRNLEAVLELHPGMAPAPVGRDAVPRFAAVTSEGSPEAADIKCGHLVVAEDRATLADRLRAEIEEGRLAHGRVWDLDATFYPWGNLALGYEVRIGGELIRPVHAVSVEGSDGGLHLFVDQLDAEAFCRAVGRRDGEARITTEILHDNSGADRLIDAQRGD
jgi:hypothetical protein